MRKSPFAPDSATETGLPICSENQGIEPAYRSVCKFVQPPSKAFVMIRGFLKNYLPRHRNRVNQTLHFIGVPLTFVGTPWTILAGTDSLWPCVCFIGGYLLQFAGHAVEGNDAGEVVFLKKKLGMAYTEYGPDAARSCNAEVSDDTSSG